MGYPYVVEETGIEVLSDTGKRTKLRGKIALCRCHCGKEFETKETAIRVGRGYSFEEALGLW